jgi:cell division protein FtsB
VNVQWWAEREAVLRLPRPSLVRIIILLAAVAVGYFIFSAVGDTLLSHKLSQDEQQVHDQIDQMSQQQKDLQNLRDYLQTDDYVEGVARRVLGLVRPGETLYIVNSDAPATPEGTPSGDSKATPEQWWERLYRR